MLSDSGHIMVSCTVSVIHLSGITTPGQARYPIAGNYGRTTENYPAVIATFVLARPGRPLIFDQGTFSRR